MNWADAELILTRAELVDFLVIGEESLVLTETSCMRLSAVPTALLVHLDRPRRESQVAHQLEKVFGPAPPQRIRAVIDDLIVHGLVESRYTDLVEDDPRPHPTRSGT